MIETFFQLCPSAQESRIDFPVHTGFFLIGCSFTNFGGKLVGSAWASDHIYNPELARYEQYKGNPNGRPGNPRSHRPPYLVHLNGDLTVASVCDIHAPMFAPGGFDGLKPFEWGGELWGDLYTGGQGSVRFFLARLEPLEGNTRITDLRQLFTSGPRRDEKNWMPDVQGNGELLFHYDVTRTAHIRQPRQPVELITRSDRMDLRTLHGGTQVVFGLGVVHDFRYDESGGRVYRHYFVRFNAWGEPIKLSRPFVLHDVERVEVVTGLANHPDGQSLVLSHGPNVVKVDIADVLQMPWDGVPQPAPPHRPPPPAPSRSRLMLLPQIGRKRPRPTVIRSGVRA